ncbi:MACPF domain-containing protein [Trifolium medium]|uniref:MACPF domain-containing protein n=1 Tax=Trifolium medium TaxID=97028 RepID=A0A392NEL6_9FABA|nr:MACPF domain-containing protein [Trifolium medium]
MQMLICLVTRIAARAQLQVEKKCLLLRLRFSKVIGATLQKPPEWDQSSNLGQSRSKFWDTARHMSHPMPGDVTIGSAPYPIGIPAPVNVPKLQRYVDPTEIIRGPEDTPGYWAVSGARFSVHNGKIYLLVNLLRASLPAELA